MALVSSGIRLVERYLLCDQIGFGGMATIHLARLLGPEGFSRTVAVKQLHPQFAQDPQFVAMFLDEARLAVRIRHGNVVSPLDIVATGGELFIVMDYVNGESLAALLRDAPFPLEPAIASAVTVHVLLGLHAAHEATSERGESLGIVHRDVSPQNILVGQDGVARVLDFGIAKAAARSQTTEEGKLKGKIGYMAPEQLRLEAVDRRADLFTTGIVLWEMLTGAGLFAADALGASVEMILRGNIVAPSTLNPAVGPELDAFVLKALEREPEQRFQDAMSMAQALQRAAPPAGVLEVMRWVEGLAGPELERKRELVRRAESLTPDELPLPGEEQTSPPLDQRVGQPSATVAALPAITLTAVSARVVADDVRASTLEPRRAPGRTERIAAVATATAETTGVAVGGDCAAPVATATGSRWRRPLAYAAGGVLAAAVTLWVATPTSPVGSSEAPTTAAGSMLVQGAKPPAPAEPPAPSLGVATPAPGPVTMAPEIDIAPAPPPASASAQVRSHKATLAPPAAPRAAASGSPVRSPVPATNASATPGVASGRDLPTTRAKGANCNPPWTINAQNIKVFKVECLR